MIKGYTDKQMKTEDERKNVVTLVPHFFPKYSITIHAASRHEAEEKLKEHIIKLQNK